MSGKKDKSDPSALTQRQVSFARSVLEGKAKTLADAYRDVYEVSGTSPAQKKSQANEASKLWRHPGVQAYVDQARKAIEIQHARRAVGEREAIRARLWNEADGDKAGDRLIALKLLGQEAGMFTESHRVEVSEHNKDMSDAEVIAEIEAALRDALAPNN